MPTGRKVGIATHNNTSYDSCRTACRLHGLSRAWFANSTVYIRDACVYTYKRVHDNCRVNVYKIKPGIERVQALADISCSAPFCRSNETRSPIANPSNTTPRTISPTKFPYHSLNFHRGPCSSVGMRRGTDRHTDGRDQYTFRLTRNATIV